MEKIRVLIRCIGSLRRVLGGSQLELFVEAGATVQAVLDRLAQERGADFARYVAWLREAREGESGSVAYAPLRVLVNGRDVFPSQVEQTRLADGDEVLIFTPVAGG